MSKMKDLPYTLDGVLSCSETIMMHEAKVALIAMVKRQRRVGPNVSLPIARGELCAKLGMDPATGMEAIRQLIKLDYFHREGDTVALVINHPVCSMLEIGPVNTVAPEDLNAFVKKMTTPAPRKGKAAAAAARAVGKDEPKPEPKRESTSKPLTTQAAVPASEGAPKMTPEDIEQAIAERLEEQAVIKEQPNLPKAHAKKRAKKRASKKRAASKA